MPLKDSCLRAGRGEDGFTNRLTNTCGKDGQNVDKCHGSEDGIIIAVVYIYVPQIKTASHWKIVNAHTPFIFNNSLNFVWQEAEKLQLSLPQNHNCSVQSNKSLCGLNTAVEIYYSVTTSWFVLEWMDFSKISKLHTDSASKTQKTAFHLSKKINWWDWGKKVRKKELTWHCQYRSSIPCEIEYKGDQQLWLFLFVDNKPIILKPEEQAFDDAQSQ